MGRGGACIPSALHGTSWAGWATCRLESRSRVQTAHLRLWFSVQACGQLCQCCCCCCCCWFVSLGTSKASGWSSMLSSPIVSPTCLGWFTCLHMPTFSLAEDMQLARTGLSPGGGPHTFQFGGSTQHRLAAIKCCWGALRMHEVPPAVHSCSLALGGHTCPPLLLRTARLLRDWLPASWWCKRRQQGRVGVTGVCGC